MPEEHPLLTPQEISDLIWKQKYSFNGEKDWLDTTKRIVDGSLFSSTKSNFLTENRLNIHPLTQLIYEKNFLPAGRIISNYGRQDNTTAFNCFVMGTIDDSLAGIMKCLDESARTMQAGGGIGMDFSTIRPKGDFVAGVTGTASGPVSFMDMWDSMCRTIMSAGSRRGAMMGTLRCDHPDILEFIHAKRDPLRLRNFNVSVLVTDALIRAVKSDNEFALKFNDKVYKHIRAKDLWDAILQNTYDFAEPGVIFIDRVNELNPARAIETIAATNPCGEQPLPPYGACLLGSMNLTKYIANPFKIDSEFMHNEFNRDVKLAFWFLDSVIDNTRYPLPQQEEEAKKKRRVGLGITGFADACVMHGYQYGDQGSISLAHSIGSALKIATDQAREELGHNNTHCTSIAPTGTISMLAGNVSSGIEPIFALEQERTIILPEGKKTFRLRDYAFHKYMELQDNHENLRGSHNLFVTSASIDVRSHVQIQGAFQTYIDSAVSKTINIPVDYSFDDFKSVYMQAYDAGCKGCTTYRPNEVTGSVLKAVDPKVEATEKFTIVDGPEVIEYRSEPLVLNRPPVLNGKTIKVKGSSHAIYITINYQNDEPYELFFNTKDAKLSSYLQIVSRLVSAVIRKGDYDFMLEELRAIHAPDGGLWYDGHFYPSVFGVVADLLDTARQEYSPLYGKCPKCLRKTAIYQDGCFRCVSCGEEKCS
jgi:ribonucleoside-diphosphate reductase alpha chain